MLYTLPGLGGGVPPGGADHEACPRPTNGRVPIYFGALTPTSRVVKRIARWGDGFIAVGSPAMVAPMVDALGKAWADHGRDGRLRLVGASYFALGDDTEAERNILDYYADFYPQLGRAAAAAMIRTPETARNVLEHYADAGYDQFNFSAAGTDPDEVDRLADAVL